MHSYGAQSEVRTNKQGRGFWSDTHHIEIHLGGHGSGGAEGFRWWTHTASDGSAGAAGAAGAGGDGGPEPWHRQLPAAWYHTVQTVRLLLLHPLVTHAHN